jgi:hypothetical protein
MEFREQYESSMAAYRAIDEDTNRIRVVRLPGSGLLMHSEAFWLGNKMFHRQPGLWFYPSDFLLYESNMYMEVYSNREEEPFEHFLPLIRPFQGNGETLLFQDKRAFFRIYLDAEERRVVRLVPIAGGGTELRQEIYLPPLSEYHFRAEGVRFVLSLASESVVSSIHLAGKLVDGWQMDDKHRVVFRTIPGAGEGTLVIRGEKVVVEEITVSIDGEPYSRATEPAVPKSVVLTSPSNVCGWSATSSDSTWHVSGTADPGAIVRLDPSWLDEFSLSYHLVKFDRSLRFPAEIVYRSEGPATIEICDSKSSVGEMF